MMRHAAICLASTIGCFAQGAPDLPKILNQVAAVYKSAKEYKVEAELTANGEPSSKNRMLFAYRAPDKYRMEGRMPGEEAQELGQMVAVDNGLTIWFFFSKPNQYGSISAASLAADAPGDLGDLRPEAMDDFMMRRFRSAVDHPDRAKFLREESIAIAGQQVECEVVIISGHTWWIDKARSLVVREDDDESSTVFTSITINQPISNQLFKFEPPAGAREIKRN